MLSLVAKTIVNMCHGTSGYFPDDFPFAKRLNEFIDEANVKVIEIIKNATVRTGICILKVLGSTNTGTAERYVSSFNGVTDSVGHGTC